MNTGFRQIGFTAPMLAMLLAGCVGVLPHELQPQYSLESDSAVVASDEDKLATSNGKCISLIRCCVYCTKRKTVILVLVRL
jgi:starvation-inducible outer membrane lipoprotein